MVTMEELTKYLKRFLSSVTVLKDIDNRIEPLTPNNLRREYLGLANDLYGIGTKKFNKLVKKFQRYDENGIPDPKLYENEIKYEMAVDDDIFGTLMDFIDNPSGKNVYLLNKGFRQVHLIYNPYPFIFLQDLDVTSLDIGSFMLDENNLLTHPYKTKYDYAKRTVQGRNWENFFLLFFENPDQTDEVCLYQYCMLKKYFKSADEAFEAYEIMKKTGNFYYKYNPNFNEKGKLMEKMYQIYKYLKSKENTSDNKE